MLYVYVGSSKPDLISQRNTQMTDQVWFISPY